MVNKIRYSISLIQNSGYRLFFRKLLSMIYSHSQMILFTKEIPKKSALDLSSYKNLIFRQAIESDFTKIANSWPVEFKEMCPNNLTCLNMIRNRYKQKHICFIGLEKEKLIGVVWCRPWYLKNLFRNSDDLSKSFEYYNEFTIPEIRGRGIGGLLLQYAMIEMANKGNNIAFSFVKLTNLSSIRMCEKIGYKNKGIITLRTILGFHFYKLDNGNNK